MSSFSLTVESAWKAWSGRERDKTRQGKFEITCIRYYVVDVVTSVSLCTNLRIEGWDIGHYQASQSYATSRNITFRYEWKFLQIRSKTK